jgi:multidrug efflux pump subunit AcrB
MSGSTADFVETEVTRPLEKALLEVRGTNFLRSSSRSELSVIEIGVNSDRVCDALSSTVAAIANVRKKLPTTTGEPVVTVNPEVKCP